MYRSLIIKLNYVNFEIKIIRIFQQKNTFNKAKIYINTFGK